MTCVTDTPLRSLLACLCFLLGTWTCAQANNSCQPGHDLPTEKLVQFHKDGSIFVKNDLNCTNTACFGGWFMLDNNRHTSQVAAYCEIYQMHDDGSVFFYTGNTSKDDQCDPQAGFCGHWAQIDQNTQTKAIAAGPSRDLNDTVAYQLHKDGSIFLRNGRPCNEPACFGGWDQIDFNAHTVAISAGFFGLFQLHDDGSIFQWDEHTRCDNNGCGGWALFDQNAHAIAISSGHAMYKMQKDNSIWRLNAGVNPCKPSSPTATCPGWSEIDGPNTDTIDMKATGEGVVKLRKDGAIFLNTGTSTGSWVQIDPNTPSNTHAVAVTGGGSIYKMLSDQSLWRFTNLPSQFCGSSVGCWQQLDANPGTAGVVVDGTLTAH